MRQEDDIELVHGHLEEQHRTRAVAGPIWLKIAGVPRSALDPLGSRSSFARGLAHLRQGSATQRTLSLLFSLSLSFFFFPFFPFIPEGYGF
jgi:hypothetical protein